MRMCVLVVCAMLCACVATVGAEDNMADLGFRLGYQEFREGDGSIMGGAYLRLPWKSVVMGECTIMYHTHEEGGVDYELIPIQLSAMVFVLRRDLAFSPYLLAGIGGYITRQVEDDDSESEFDLGWHLGFGLDFRLSDRVFVEGDVRYIWLDVDFEGETAADALSDFNNLIGSVGIGFRL